MHQQAAQKGAEVLQVLAVEIVHALVGRVIVPLVAKLFARGHLVVDRIKTHADTDQYRGDGKGIQKRLQKGRDHREQQ